jgi:uncharacterized coiled-coil protein SlyX
MQVTSTSEAQIQTETTDKQLEPVVQKRTSSRKSILALSVFALAINGTAAIYTMPSYDFALPDFSGMAAELFPHQKAPAPIPEAVVAALKDIQSTQQQNTVVLGDNGFSLQQNAVLLQHDTVALDGLRQSLTDERVDVRKISTQLSTLIAKVEALQSAIAPEITSSIPKGHARNRLSEAARKRMARRLKPLGPVSIGGAPLTMAPVQAQGPEG